MAEYQAITIEEMDRFLTGQGFVRIDLPGTVEAVYAKRVHLAKNQILPLSLRVYTSIDANGLGRGIGKDAIRVVLFTRDEQNRPVKISGGRRVHRVKGWKSNLSDRLRDWMTGLEQCECGSLMRVVKGPNGKFLGCARYPHCRKTRKMKGG